MMRTRHSAEFERAMKKCDGNVDIRKECERNETFKKEFIKSMRAPRELLEELLGNMSLKEFQDMNSINNIKKLSKVSEF